jgi:DNA-directed RNA polymerase subunit K/omega
VSVTDESMPAEITETVEQPAEKPVPVPPIQSRFLFVNVAALRAKQLRRGALPRVAESANPVGALPHKAERTAMQEVREGLVSYELPVQKKPAAGGG